MQHQCSTQHFLCLPQPAGLRTAALPSLKLGWEPWPFSCSSQEEIEQATSSFCQHILPSTIQTHCLLIKWDSVPVVTEHLQDRIRQPQSQVFWGIWNWDQNFPVCCNWPTLLRWVQAWPTSPFLKSWHYSQFASGEGLHSLSFTAGNQQPTHPCLVPVPNTGPEHSWGSSSSKPHLLLLSSLGPALWTERSFENIAWHRQSTVLGSISRE